MELHGFQVGLISPPIADHIYTTKQINIVTCNMVERNGSQTRDIPSTENALINYM